MPRAAWPALSYVLFEGAAPHTLLVLAEAGLAAALILDTVFVARTGLRIARLAYRGELLQGPLAKGQSMPHL
jgi:hypothetical protein